MKNKTTLKLVAAFFVIVFALAYTLKNQAAPETLAEVIKENKIAVKKGELGLTDESTAASSESYELPPELTTPENRTELTNLYAQMKAVDMFLDSNHVMESLNDKNLDAHKRDELIDALIVKQKIVSKISIIQLAAGEKLLAEMKK